MAVKTFYKEHQEVMDFCGYFCFTLLFSLAVNANSHGEEFQVSCFPCFSLAPRPNLQLSSCHYIGKGFVLVCRSPSATLNFAQDAASDDSHRVSPVCGLGRAILQRHNMAVKAAVAEQEWTSDLCT
jgi:hypothetical protein